MGGSRALDGGRPPAAGDLLTEVVDVRAARISARGRLALRGAELLAATVAQLRRSGAPCIVVDLSLVTEADPAALALLATVQRDLAAAGARLLLSGLRVGQPSSAVPAPLPVDGCAPADAPRHER
jgi:STAS domain